MLKAALFDMDGTLLESMGLWHRFGELYLCQQGIPVPEGLNDLLDTMTLNTAAEYLARLTGQEPSAVKEGLFEVVGQGYSTTVEPKPGALELLARLKSGGVKLALVTATDLPLARRALDRLGMTAFFDGLWDCRTVGQSKHHPTIYQRASEALGATPGETWVFEDALYAALTAKEAGYSLIGIADSYEEGQEELKALSTFYVTHYDQLDEPLKALGL